ncbi:hypothetical protein B1218_37500, partial [Pseudomonas ogarae]
AYYTIGVGPSQIYSNGSKDAKTSEQATKAGADNPKPLQAGRGDLAPSAGASLAYGKKDGEEAGVKARGSTARVRADG